MKRSLVALVALLALGGCSAAKLFGAPAPRASAPRASVAPAGGIGTCRLARRHYRTLRGIRTPGFCVVRRSAAGTAPGLLLVTPRPGGPRAPGRGQFAAMILTNRGRLLWYSRRHERV